MWEHDRKLNRSAEHFAQLKAQVIGWEEGHGYSLRTEPHPRPPHYVLRAQVVRPIEHEPFPLVLGDFLQNARAALDYLAGELGHVGAGGFMSEQDALQTMFPVASSPEQFANVVQRRLPTVSAPVRAAIADLQPYQTGGDLWQWEPLWILNELARFDRHRFLQVGAGQIGLVQPIGTNVRIENLQAEEYLEGAEVDALEDAELARAEGRIPKDGAILATFEAFPIDPKREMDMKWESAIQIGFDVDRLPDSLDYIGGRFGMGVIEATRGIVPDMREVFRALSPFLPDRPQW